MFAVRFLESILNNLQFYLQILGTLCRQFFKACMQQKAAFVFKPETIFHFLTIENFKKN